VTQYQTILVDERDAIATVTINRPNKLNALDRSVIRELTSAFDALVDTRVAILTGAGDKAFVAGADIGEMSEMSAAEAKAFSESGHRLGALLENLAFPVIAAVNGYALGGGCELALACDFIYASDKARFGQPEVNLGLMPGFGGTQRLARRVGVALARELVYSGEPIDAARALDIGLVNAVVPHADLLDRVRAVAHKIAKKAPLAIGSSKRAFSRGVDADLAVGSELESALFSALFASEDMREGTRAFVEKRDASFQGR